VNITVFWDVESAAGGEIIEVPEEPAASIFKADYLEDGGRGSLRNTGPYLLKYTM
jgi:hypothetical protein